MTQTCISVEETEQIQFGHEWNWVEVSHLFSPYNGKFQLIIKFPDVHIKKVYMNTYTISHGAVPYFHGIMSYPNAQSLLYDHIYAVVTYGAAS